VVVRIDGFTVVVRMRFAVYEFRAKTVTTHAVFITELIGTGTLARTR
jgi:hypothetical protein